MALYKKYYNKKIELKFYPDDMVIYLEPKRDGSKGDLRFFKEKLQVFLNVKSSNFTRSQGKPVFTLQLDKNTPSDSVDEYLKQKFHGGDEVEDPATMGQEEETEPVQQQPEPEPGQQPNPQPQSTGPEMQPQEEEPQMESLFLKAFELFTESTYRTAKYWDTLARASGKGKQSIDEKVVLSLRRQFTKKPKSKNRNETLRALDKAMSYFYRKLKNSQGENFASDFKKKYREIGDLVPSDYSDETKHEKPSPEDSSPFEASGETNKETLKKMLSFEDFFDEDGDGEDEEDAYEKYEKFESET